jgi:hypothetical protein
MFYSEDTCVAARDAVLADGRRVKTEHDQVQIDAAQAAGTDAALFLASKQSPSVSAVCAAQYEPSPSVSAGTAPKAGAGEWSAVLILEYCVVDHHAQQMMVMVGTIAVAT